MGFEFVKLYRNFVVLANEGHTHYIAVAHVERIEARRLEAFWRVLIATREQEYLLGRPFPSRDEGRSRSARK